MIPSTWTYIKTETVDQYCFEGLIDRHGAFIVSVKRISNLINSNIDINLLPFQEFNKKILFRYTLTKFDNIECHSWIGKVEKYIVLVTYTSLGVLDEDEFKLARNAAKSIILISDDLSEKVKLFGHFYSFNIALYASIDLSNFAIKRGAHIELLVVLSNRIDAYLRMMLILKFQIQKGFSLFDKRLVHQNKNEKGITEREIYKIALMNNIINDTIFKRLNDQYDIRNRIIHRYVIDDIKLRDVIDAVWKLFQIEENIFSILENFENEQIKKKVGFYGEMFPIESFVPEFNFTTIRNMVNEKHSVLDRYNKLTRKDA